MAQAAIETRHPYIGSDAAIAGGAPIIAGTRITVRCIAGYYQTGMSVDEILATLRHLTASQVHSALAYYFDHKDAVDQDLDEAADIFQRGGCPPLGAPE